MYLQQQNLQQQLVDILYVCLSVRAFLPEQRTDLGTLLL